MYHHLFVVLAYKESPYLERCIASVLDQSNKSKVVIVTSTPNIFIKNMAIKYGLPLIVNKDRLSIGNDFDFAIKAVKSDLVTIAHQDDIYDRNYAEDILKKFILHKNAIILFSDYYEIRDNKKEASNINLRIKRLLLLPLRMNSISHFKIVKRIALAFGNPICCPAVTFVQEKISLPLFESKFKCNVDWHAWETLSKTRGSFIFLSSKSMGHRVHGDSTTTEIIRDNIRTKEDLEIFNRFWPIWFAKILNKFYAISEKSNNTSNK